jgi:hypothetical protein
MSDFSVSSAVDWSGSQKSGQDVLLNEIRFKKRMTTAEAVKLIGKTAPATLLVLARNKHIRVISRGLYGSV